MALVIQIVGVRIAACDGEDPGTEDVRYCVSDLGRIAGIRDQLGQPINQPKSVAGAGQQQDAPRRNCA